MTNSDIVDSKSLIAGPHGLGNFYGIGVGPGGKKMLSVAAYEALKECSIVYLPRARSAGESIAMLCLAELDLPAQVYKEVVFKMDAERSSIAEHYNELAGNILEDLRRGANVAYLTIGDALTYSTYGYLLDCLLALEPQLPRQTFAGITSYAAIASACDWPLGQGKERMLILPCPDEDELAQLEEDIEKHDLVVLMKIGHRLEVVLSLLARKGYLEHCAFASRLGLADEVVLPVLSLESFAGKGAKLGYLSTMLIRKSPVSLLTSELTD